MSSQVVAALFVLSCIQFLRCEGLVVEIEPFHSHVYEHKQNITFYCRGNAPLTGCQFTWWDDYRDRDGPVLDFSQGAESKSDPAHTYPGLLSYGYSGRGLETGECGLRVEVHEFKYWMIRCRVKAGGNWSYEWATLRATDGSTIPHTVETRNVVALQGGTARLMLKADWRLKTCKFTLTTRHSLNFDEGAKSADSGVCNLYHGAGLDSGECGLAVVNVTERDNGLYEVGINSKYKDWEARVIFLIVARPPSPPVLHVDYDNNDVTATCRVQESRPLANITWMLGEEIVRQDSEDDSPGSADDAWRWPYIAGSTYQKLTRKLQPQDIGKQLKCSVSHVALTEPLEVSEVISLKVTTERITSTTSLPDPAITAPSSPSTTATMLSAFEESWDRASRLQSACCLSAAAAQLQSACCLSAAAAQLAEEIGRVNLEAAKSRARQEEAWDKIAEEKLLFQREMHRRQLQ